MPTVPPPPPMPILAAGSNFIRNSIDQNNNNNNKLDLNGCFWAVADSDVQRACYFSRTCVLSSPTECAYLKVDPILQTGKL